MDDIARIRSLVGTAKNIADRVGGVKNMTSDVRASYDALLAEAERLRAGVDAKNAEPVHTHQMGFGAAVDGKGLRGADDDVTGAVPGQAKTVSPAEWAKSAADELASIGRASKAVVSGSLSLPVVVADVVADPREANRLLQLIQAKPIGENAYAYVRQTVRETNATAVADYGTKPTSTYTFEEVSDRARVVAHLSEPVPQRFWQDHSEIVNLLQGEMAGGLLDAVEAQVIAGDGQGENMLGLLNTPGLTQVAYATSVVNTLRHARTVMQLANETPNSWVLHPADAEALDLTREDGTTGGFLDTSGILGNVPVVVSNAATQGQAILGDFRLTRLYVREGSRLDIDTSGENFTNNTAVLRAEQRANVAVLRPAAIALVDLTSA